MFALFMVITTAIVALGVWQAYELGPFFRAEITRLRAVFHGLLVIPLRIERTILSLLGWFSSRVESFLESGQGTREERVEKKFDQQKSNLQGYYRKRLMEAWRRQEEQTE